MPNRLTHASSPYLRQHEDNPVDWFEWSEEAFAEAALRDVPIILSVGYATCHWCHVMAHESFEDTETAAYMNEHFVNIKVDREERPDIDRIYMDAVTAMTGRGGWPMTVFLTPDGAPIFAGTYYPKRSMGHHPSFMDVMGAVLDAWRTNRAGALDQANRIAEAIAQNSPPAAGLPTMEDIDRSVAVVANTFDRVNGGFGTAPKFPQAPTLELLMRTAVLRPDTDAAATSLSMLTQMLTSMARGGIYDHLFGGFARYSVDAQWLIPHFEKMLYDNALLARVYLRTWQITGDASLLDTAIEVLDYLDGPMADPTGGVHSAEDADSEGVEGRFAVWTWDELGAVLGTDRELAAAIYGATPEGNFEGANNLHRFVDLADVATAAGSTVDEVIERKASIDDRLRAIRRLRVPPARDDKLVAAWNGMALRAFAEAAAILGSNRYLARATAIAEFLVSTGSPDGNLVRSWRDTSGHPAFADDHAAVALGMYALYQATGDERWFTAAEGHVARLRRDFAADGGGFHATSAGSELFTRPINTQDNPTPSDNALTLEALLTHAAFTGDLAAVADAEATMRRIASTALQHPGFGGYALAVWLTHLSGVKEVALVGEDTTAMAATVWSTFRPDVVVAVGDGSPSAVPLLADRPGGTPVLAYVCENLVCALPVDTPGALATSLATQP
ncbi:thioredoxin domain-containing protein [Actinomycetota bacterium]